MDKNRLRDAARNNIVTIMFIVLCAVCMACFALLCFLPLLLDGKEALTWRRLRSNI